MSTPPDPTIEVFADIWCPFAHVGLRAIQERAGPERSHRRVDLGPSVAVAIGERRAPRSDGHLATRRRTCESRSPRSCSATSTSDRFPTSTLDALALANRAYRSGLHSGERASFALRDALFEEGRDVSDPRRPRIPGERSGRGHARRSPTARLSWRTGTKESGAVSSAHHISSVATPTCSALRSTSRRKPSRACRSSGTLRV